MLPLKVKYYINISVTQYYEMCEINKAIHVLQLTCFAGFHMQVSG